MKKILALVILLLSSMMAAFAENNTASAQMSFDITEYVSIQPVLSPVLTAHITDRTGNLHVPLHTKFKVISNCAVPKTLYLKANTVTEGGYEEAIFAQSGQVYIAFGNLVNRPSSQALANCKMGGLPKDSPNVVAYPITSVVGAKNKFLGNKYEIEVENGATYVSVNVGTNVLRSSFASNDKRGFYQAIVSLTEADI